MQQRQWFTRRIRSHERILSDTNMCNANQAALISVSHPSHGWKQPAPFCYTRRPKAKKPKQKKKDIFALVVLRWLFLLHSCCCCTTTTTTEVPLGKQGVCLRAIKQKRIGPKVCNRDFLGVLAWPYKLYDEYGWPNAPTVCVMQVACCCLLLLFASIPFCSSYYGE